MKASKIIFLISLIGILTLLILSSNKKEEIGKIKEIEYSNNKITITIENKKESIVIFTDKIFDLKKRDTIIYSGKKEIYNGNPQIIADRVYKR